MSFATDKWFKHLNNELITEGLDDIGLSKLMINLIRAAMPDASEKGRVWVGNAWKSEDPVMLRRSGPKFWVDAMEMLEKISESDAFAQSRYDDDRNPDEIPPNEADKNNILDNAIETYRRRGMSNWSKARRKFIKKASQANLPDEVVIKAVAALDDLERGTWEDFSNRKISNVITTLNQNPNNYDMIKSTPPGDWDEAEMDCYQFQQEQEDPDQIMHTFDDGSYWYDLQSSNCSVEGDRMGHCGSDQRGTLYSLRKKDENKKFSSSYVTIAYNSYDKIIYQIKGRANEAPPESVWGHIAWFIDKTETVRVEERGEYSNDQGGFDRMTAGLIERTDGVEFPNSPEERAKELLEECENVRERYYNAHKLEGVKLDGVYIEDGDGEEYMFWYDQVREIIVPFIDIEMTEVLAAKINKNEGGIKEAIIDIINEEDRNDIFDQRQWEVEIVSAVGAEPWLDGLEDAQRPDEASYYYAFYDLSGIQDHFMYDNGNNMESAGYEEFLDLASDFVQDVYDAQDDIQSLLIERKLLKRPEVLNYADKVKEEFNNFRVVEDSKNKIDVVSSGVLFNTTLDEMDTILFTLNFADHPTIRGGLRRNYYASTPAFRNEIIEELAKSEKAAADFAKKQMKLNYGPEYEKKIDSIWDTARLSEFFESNLYAGIKMIRSKTTENPRPAQKMDSTVNRFDYKFSLKITSGTLPVFGPFMEYYDNNFELITNAFSKVVKKMIADRLKDFKDKTDNDTNLPDSVTEATTLDVRLYEIDFVMSYPLGVGFEMTDIHNIIRAIPDVTTVRTKGKKRRAADRTVSVQNLKFALRGQKNRMEWVRQVLLPQIHKIDPSIKILRVDRADAIGGASALKEYFGSYSMRQSPGRVTPTPRIQQILDDWMQGGVMYDSPMLTNISREHVMIPVEDIEHLLSRNPRKHGDHFEAGYQNFIQIGPRDPIYIAVGKNGRVKITGNEDDLRYAIKAGVEEVPVYFSYQTQV